MDQAEGVLADRSLRRSSSFPFDTISDFDRYIAREIEGYELLDHMVVRLAESALEPRTTFYDIGCSTGRLLNRVAARADAAEPDRGIRYVGFDCSLNFAAAFKPYSKDVEFRLDVVNRTTTFPGASVVTALFALQFMPTQDRVHVLRNVHEGLVDDGVLVLAEKVYASDSRIERLMDDRRLDFKRRHSSAETILDKDECLRRILHPVTLAQNQDMLARAGFRRVEVFWRIANFVALVALK